jgi:hypothetical protein
VLDCYPAQAERSERDCERQQQVAEITESEYFQALKARLHELRRRPEEGEG